VLDSTGELGATLQRAREARGLSLDDVAQALKFTTGQIEALEAGKDLPMAPAYATGFVRCYARYLGETALRCSVDDLVAAFRAESGLNKLPYESEAEPRRPSVGLGQMPRAGLSVLSGALVLAGAAYMAWQLFSGPGANAAPVAAEIAYRDTVKQLAAHRFGE